VVAAAGLIGDPLPLEGRRGLLALVSEGADATRLADDLGVVWRAEVAAPNDGALRTDALYEAASQLADSGDLAAVLNEAELLAEH
jgi:hypothetical protein